MDIFFCGTHTDLLMRAHIQPPTTRVRAIWCYRVVVCTNDPLSLSKHWGFMILILCIDIDGLLSLVDFWSPIRIYLSHARYCSTPDDDIRVRIITTLPIKFFKFHYRGSPHQSDTQEQRAPILLQQTKVRLLLRRW